MISKPIIDVRRRRWKPNYLPTFTPITQYKDDLVTSRTTTSVIDSAMGVHGAVPHPSHGSNTQSVNKWCGDNKELTGKKNGALADHSNNNNNDDDDNSHELPATVQE